MKLLYSFSEKQALLTALKNELKNAKDKCRDYDIEINFLIKQMRLKRASELIELIELTKKHIDLLGFLIQKIERY